MNKAFSSTWPALFMCKNELQKSKPCKKPLALEMLENAKDEY